jgi:hypothetical protein
MAVAEAKALVTELSHLEALGQNDRGQKRPAGCDGLFCDTERG